MCRHSRARGSGLEPGSDRVELSPLNQSDLLLARGVYGMRPALPTVIGNEGVGRVLALGPGVEKSGSGTAYWPRFPASRGESEWLLRRMDFSPCLLTPTLSSWRCWRSILRPRRC